MHFLHTERWSALGRTVRSLCMVLVLSGLLVACNSAQSPSTTSPTPPVPATSTLPVSPTSTAVGLLRPDMERGMIYPRYNQTSYGPSDGAWRSGIQAIKSQAGAGWIEIPVLLTQDTIFSTSVGPGVNAPTLSAFASGIQQAHTLGYHVFVTIVMKINTGDWGGQIRFSTQSQEQAWFDSYWKTLQPYATAAQQNGVEQLAIGTELEWLAHHAPDALWNQLIARVHGVFQGTLTYDMNWYQSLSQPPPAWLKNPDLGFVGLSEYVSIVSSSEQVNSQAMVSLWKQNVGTLIDAFSAQVGKKIVISEIGYRDTFDTFYNPFNANSSAPVDNAAQSAAYDAAFTNIFADQNIAGVFCWGWNGAGRLNLAGKPALQIIKKWYTMSAT